MPEYQAKENIARKKRYIVKNTWNKVHIQQTKYYLENCNCIFQLMVLPIVTFAARNTTKNVAFHPTLLRFALLISTSISTLFIVVFLAGMVNKWKKGCNQEHYWDLKCDIIINIFQ